MRKSVILLGLSLGCFFLGACSEDKVEHDLSDIAGLDVQSHALKTRTFEDLAGEPWPTATEYRSHLLAPADPTALFGSRMVVGDLDGNGRPDLIVSENAFQTDATSPSRLYVYQNVGDVSASLPLVMQDATRNGLGVGLIVGPYCTNGQAGDSIVVSSPAASGFQGVIDVVRLVSGSLTVTKSMKHTSPGLQLAGRNIAVGDVNSDNKPDLIVLITPNVGNVWVEARLGIVLDFCNAGEELVYDVELNSESAGRNFGWSIQVMDLDGLGEPEIVVVEDNYGDSTPRQGAVHFYKYKDVAGVKTIAKSRDALVGPTNSGLRTVTFADIDADGDLDLVVGLVMADYNATIRNGSARTLVNRGPGLAFDMSTPARWSFENPSGHQYFGSSLLAVDINNDGVRDLIVGAPARDTISATSKAVSSVWVFLGTSDGSVFTKTPYWRHLSAAGAASNDELGRILAVGNVNGKGWLDIFATGRNFNKGSNPVKGRVLNFLSTNESCYRADRCLVKGVCYNKGEASPDNACLVCDPLKNNFGFVDIVCLDTANPCKTVSCDVALGCLSLNHPDGESCGAMQCNANLISTPLCKTGACVTSSLSCGVYVCVSDSMSCKTSCESDADCSSNTCNSLGKCAIDLAPKVIIDYPKDAPWNKPVVIDASTSTDPEGFALNFEWKPISEGIIFKNVSNGVIQIQTPSYDLLVVIQLIVTDVYGNKVTEDIQINVTNSENKAPVVSVIAEVFGDAGDMVALDASGSTDPNGDALKFVWSMLSAQAGVLTNTTKAVANFTIPADAIIGSIYNFNVAVSDGSVSVDGQVIVTVTGDPVEYIPVITSPKPGSPVASPVTITGTVRGASSIEVMTRTDDVMESICVATVVDELWSCIVVLPVGTYIITAHTIGGAESRISKEVTFSVRDEGIIAPVITSPKTGSAVASPVTITGTAKNASTIDVMHRTEGAMAVLCTAAVVNDQWSCIVVAPVGTYNITAHTVEAVPRVSEEITFYVPDEGIVAPVIISPVTGEVISISPTVQGTIDQAGGVVTVWLINKGNRTELCKAPVVDKTWFCAPEFSLLPDTSYTISADWRADGLLSWPSPLVEVKTAADIKYIVITSPPNDVSLQSQQPVIIAGTAPADTEVSVYLNGGAVAVCKAIANFSGKWFCSDLTLDINSYTIEAVIVLDGKEHRASSKFQIVPCINCPQDPSLSYVRGGSCSVGRTRTESRSWLLVFPILLGVSVLRRRRRQAA